MHLNIYYQEKTIPEMNSNVKIYRISVKNYATTW